jgi:predicted nucleic acid-binding Zn ribbon protein
MSESGPTTCEVCGASPLVRVLHPVAVHYKGSGFYSTDYGRGSRKGSKDSGGDSSSSDSGSGSGSSSSESGSGSGSDSGSSSTTAAAD